MADITPLFFEFIDHPGNELGPVVMRGVILLGTLEAIQGLGQVVRAALFIAKADNLLGWVSRANLHEVDGLHDAV